MISTKLFLNVNIIGSNCCFFKIVLLITVTKKIALSKMYFYYTKHIVMYYIYSVTVTLIRR